jgi:hypothetical protein
MSDERAQSDNVEPVDPDEVDPETGTDAQNKPVENPSG